MGQQCTQCHNRKTIQDEAHSEILTLQYAPSIRQMTALKIESNQSHSINSAPPDITNTSKSFLKLSKEPTPEQFEEAGNVCQQSLKISDTSHLFANKSEINMSYSNIFTQQNITNVPENYELVEEIPGEWAHVTSIHEKYGEITKPQDLIEYFSDCQFLNPYKFPDGSIYAGQWSHGIRNGFGKLYEVDGTYYEGFWINDLRHYYGRSIDRDGYCYIGNWFANKMQGDGKFINKDGSMYEIKANFSDLEKGLRNNSGQFMLYNNGNCYYGPRINYKREGFGVLEYKDGTSYVGYFKEDKFDGYGILKFKNGSIYEGEFHQGMMDGIGEFTSSDGKYYLGSYVGDVKQGYGYHTFGDGVYRGGFMNGKMHGLGRLIDKKGRKVDAIFKEGRRIKKIKENEQNN